jgi:exosortase/archaeosortase
MGHMFDISEDSKKIKKNIIIICTCFYFIMLIILLKKRKGLDSFTSFTAFAFLLYIFCDSIQIGKTIFNC